MRIFVIVELDPCNGRYGKMVCAFLSARFATSAAQLEAQELSAEPVERS